MTYLKSNTIKQEDPDDVFMAYLNADYFDAETPLSPPSSTSSGSSSPYSSSTASPVKHDADEFMMDKNSTDFDIHDIDDSATSWDDLTAVPNSLFINSCLTPPSPSIPMPANGAGTSGPTTTTMTADLLNGFPLLLPPVNPFITPFVTTETTVDHSVASNSNNTSHTMQQYISPPLSTVPSNLTFIPQPSNHGQQPQQQEQQQGRKNSSSSETEQPKKKRGRRKREPVNHHQHQPYSVPPTLLAPKPLAPRFNTTEFDPRSQQKFSSTSPPPSSTTTSTIDNGVKSETQPALLSPSPSALSTTSLHSHTTKNLETSNTIIATGTTATNNSNGQQQQQLSQEASRQAQIKKRQERLIKNRAAALLSRKRKREHLNSLEEDKQRLTRENEQLTQKVQSLETQLRSLEEENQNLKMKLKMHEEGDNNQQTVIQMSSQSSSSTTNNKSLSDTNPCSQHQQQKPTRSTGVMFMVKSIYLHA
ncbi:hypothetical protein BDF20DRAFT_330698 [Mycotypha africana]|uniref:uncharacterized protein n=1 Tax=Mycotypha africana TaxID=64632 RepID=UPI0023012923|nr:uncharacterized protein BDF20DRAFT_330698 [Mycotypha africana]KAI8988418.1 hypothetical protein BDF20DRAFT_330698 [Mycotypha africana]